MVADIEQRVGETNNLKSELKHVKDELEQLTISKQSLDDKNILLNQSNEVIKNEISSLKDELVLKSAQLTTENERSADLQVCVFIIFYPLTLFPSKTNGTQSFFM